MLIAGIPITNIQASDMLVADMVVADVLAVDMAIADTFYSLHIKRFFFFLAKSIAAS